ncbi:TPA: hypothetical protein RQN23_000693 [Aeromonas veronii]|nr:hypothetical protein [Aeromonas veronii]
MNLHEEYQRCLALFPLILADQLISPVASTKGATGYGEGFVYGKHMRSDRTFFYRFSGKAIPRDTVAYVTAEDGFFSRVKGDRTQAIVMWDNVANGFRILHLHNSSFGFREKFNEIKANVPEAVVRLGHEYETQQKAAETMKELINSGVKIF